MKKVQFQADLQRSFSPYLPHWRKYLRKALYRKTEDFVQWTYFTISQMPEIPRSGHVYFQGFY